MKRRLLLISVLVFLAAGCTPNSTVPQAWFDQPLTGTSFPPSPVIEILLHAADPGGISQVELFVNGSSISILPSPDTGPELVQISTQWLPSAPGKYTLQARAQGNSGTWSNFATTIIIISDLPAREQESPTADPTISTIEAVREMTATGTPTLGSVLPSGTARPTALIFTPTRTPTMRFIPPTATPTPTARYVPPTATPTPTARYVPPTATPSPTTRYIPPTDTAIPTREILPTNTPGR